MDRRLCLSSNNPLTAVMTCGDTGDDSHPGPPLYACAAGLDAAVSIFTGGRHTSDQRGAEDLSREGFNPGDYDWYSW